MVDLPEKEIRNSGLLKRIPTWKCSNLVRSPSMSRVVWPLPRAILGGRHYHRRFQRWSSSRRFWHCRSHHRYGRRIWCSLLRIGRFYSSELKPRSCRYWSSSEGFPWSWRAVTNVCILQQALRAREEDRSIGDGLGWIWV